MRRILLTILVTAVLSALTACGTTPGSNAVGTNESGAVPYIPDAAEDTTPEQAISETVSASDKM